MGGGGSHNTVSYQRATTPDVYAPVAPERTKAEVPDDISKALFTQGVEMNETEKDKKYKTATSRLVIPLDNSNSSLTGGTTPPPTPTGVI